MSGILPAACSDLPVQVEAVVAFRDFVEALAESERLGEKLHPILTDLLRHLFHLASLVEATDIVTTLETIVENIGEDIQPFARDVCQQVRACACGIERVLFWFFVSGFWCSSRRTCFGGLARGSLPASRAKHCAAA